MTELTDMTEAGTLARRATVALPHDGATRDDRFRSLMTREAWARLPAVVRHRFTEPLATSGQRTFAGHVIHTAHSRAGQLLARLAHLVGGPLPDTHGATGRSTVVVTRDDILGGQIWSRTYARPGRMPQTINSVKRFAGPTGLEEYLGSGLIMRLTLHEDAGELVFRSAGYDVAFAGIRWALPRLATPGTCIIRHRDEGGGWFTFTLTLDHPWLGRLVEQVAVYEEIGS
ncbi:MAG: DUF4166 domain-containing protein [Hyphomicrobiaceae bacterium]